VKTHHTNTNSASPPTGTSHSNTGRRFAGAARDHEKVFGTSPMKRCSIGSNNF
jgi:hypothetical protein